MQWATLAAIYFIAWWITLFAVLPLGVESQGSDAADGTDPGAPTQPRLPRKVAITTVLAIPAAALIYWFIRYAV
jgi:predicted secreted protein